ncbi:MAG: hypothetical protein ACRD9R_24025, partial [Pyrinomonadaceae bacterium]
MAKARTDKPVRSTVRPRWRLVPLFLTLFLLPVSPSPPRPLAPSPLRPFAFAKGEVTTATSEGRLAVFDEVWATLRERYYDPQLHGVDWATQRTALRPVAAEADNAAEFYA